MKEKIMNNFSLKLLAGVLAVIVWVIVNNIDDPMIPKTFKNITVQLQNEQAISSLDKVYEVMSGGTVDVTVYGKQSVVRKITEKDIVAVADLSQLSLTYAASIQLSCPKYENVELSSDVDMLCISLEEKKTKRCGVSVMTHGTPAEGHALGEVKKSVAAIEVSGPKSVVERVDEVCVEVNVEGVSDDFSTRLVPRAYDANDKLIDSDALSFGVSKIKVTVMINDTKSVPIKVVTNGTPAEGYHVIAVEANPASIEVTGPDANLDKCEAITITYDVSHCNADIYEEVALAEHLPKDIRVVDESVTAVNVLVTISKQKLQTVSIPVSAIEMRNLPDGYEADFNGSDGQIEVSAIWLAGQQNEQMTSSDFSPYIDCKGLEIGTHTLMVQFDENPKLRIESSASVRINIKEVEKDVIVEHTAKPVNTLKPTVEPEVAETEVVQETTEPEGAEEDKEKKSDNLQD